MISSNRRGSGLRKYYVISLEIGLILALVILITAVRFGVPSGETEFQVRLQTQEVVNMEEIKQTEQQMEAPPPPKAPVPIEVPDNVVIEQEQELDFDASLDLSASLDTAMGAPPTVRSRSDRHEEPEDEIFIAVEQEPELIGGLAALQRKVKYPDFAQKAGIEGRVFVRFVVNKEGNVENPTVTRGVHRLLNEEALRVVKKMKFRPGKQRDRPVKVQMTLPVNFKLEKRRPPSDA